MSGVPGFMMQGDTIRISSATPEAAFARATARSTATSPAWKRIFGLLPIAAGRASRAARQAWRQASLSFDVIDGHSPVDPPRMMVSTPCCTVYLAYRGTTPRLRVPFAKNL